MVGPYFSYSPLSQTRAHPPMSALPERAIKEHSYTLVRAAI